MLEMAEDLRDWVKQAEADAGERDGLTSGEREELALLPRENRGLREDVDILKRATAFFAKETRWNEPFRLSCRWFVGR
ncbi:transposase [Streptomyces lavendulae]|uniref:transposase n=1 Tax=Streptomyces lavendulae TaxID=1914 RepID=UPI003F4CAF37